MPVAALILMLASAITGCKAPPEEKYAAKGEIAPDFTLEDIEGREVTLSSFRGKVVLVEFWATWCAPCRESMPALENLYRKYRGKGLVVLGIAVKDLKEKVKELTADKGITYTGMMDDEVVSRLFRVREIPALFMLDKKGVVRHILTGYRPSVDDEIAERVEALLAEEPAQGGDGGH